MTLKDLPIGKTATVTVVGGEGALRQHFLDMQWLQQRRLWQMQELKWEKKILSVSE